MPDMGLACRGADRNEVILPFRPRAVAKLDLRLALAVVALVLALAAALAVAALLGLEDGSAGQQRDHAAEQPANELASRSPGRQALSDRIEAVCLHGFPPSAPSMWNPLRGIFIPPHIALTSGPLVSFH